MEYVKLSDVAKIDRTVASEQECKSLPYVGLEHIQKETGRFSDNFKRIPEQLLATKFKFTSAHVLYGKLRPYLNKVARPNFEGVCTTEILPLLPKSQKLDRDFLWAILLTQGFVYWASKNISGANLPRLDPKVLANYEIPLPSLDEQRRIAAIARKCDRLRRTRRFTQQLSNTYLQSVYLEMFGDPTTNPKCWEDCLLEDLCKLIIDCPHTTPTYSQSVTTYPCIRTSDLQDGFLDWSTTKYVELGEYEFRVKRHTPIPRDVLYSREGERFGIAALVPKKVSLCLGQRMMLLQANSELARGEFLWGLMNSPGIYQQANDLVGGSTSPHVNVGDIKKFKAYMPSLEFQEKFAQIVQHFERLRTQQREAERQAEHLFQTVLHRAFRGEL